MRFLLGTHQPNWLEQLDVPLFVSHRRLARYKRMPRARTDWALDSGAFTELNLHGHFQMSTAEYVDAVARYGDEVGRMLWAAPMDWMCEPFMIERTGLSVAEHQHRTVANYLELRSQGPFIPVLQGWTLGDYERCTDLYADAGVDLSAAPVVGLGSVCRRQDTAEIGRIVTMLHGAGIACHGFGVKKKGVIRYGDLLTSADSLAWSYRARRDWPLPGCTHRSCTNCPHYALKWRRELLTWQDQLVLGAGT
jgi:hypothetical protein